MANVGERVGYELSKLNVVACGQTFDEKVAWSFRSTFKWNGIADTD